MVKAKKKPTILATKSSSKVIAKKLAKKPANSGRRLSPREVIIGLGGGHVTGMNRGRRRSSRMVVIGFGGGHVTGMNRGRRRSSRMVVIGIGGGHVTGIITDEANEVAKFTEVETVERKVLVEAM